MPTQRFFPSRLTIVPPTAKGSYQISSASATLPRAKRGRPPLGGRPIKNGASLGVLAPSWPPGSRHGPRAGVPKERPCEETIPPAPLLSTGSGGLMGWEGTEARPISASQGVWEDARSEGFAVKVQGERGFGWILAAAALREIFHRARAVELFRSLQGRRGEQRPVPRPQCAPWPRAGRSPGLETPARLLG